MCFACCPVHGIHRYDSSDNKERLGPVAKLFFVECREQLQQFIAGANLEECKQLNVHLQGYCTGAIVMQKLESRHHLVHQRLLHSPASLPGHLSAALGQTINNDLTHPLFRRGVERYLSKIPELALGCEFRSKSEFYAIVFGYHIELLHPDTRSDQLLISAFRARNQCEVTELTPEEKIRRQHLLHVLIPGGFYRIGTQVFQVINTAPGKKKYVEKTSGLATDMWHNALAVAILNPEDTGRDDGSITVASRLVSTVPMNVKELLTEDGVVDIATYAATAMRQEFILQETAGYYHSLDGGLSNSIQNIGNSAIAGALSYTKGSGHQDDLAVSWMLRNGILVQPGAQCIFKEAMHQHMTSRESHNS